ncbi:leaf rust 10 disease-resistance locus receptor-like protein kinase-like 2.1, partial [Quercus suber]
WNNSCSSLEGCSSTIEVFLLEIAREKPIRFTANELCSFTRNYSKTLDAMTVACGIEEKDREKAIRMSMVALWCVQDSPEARPPMSAAVKMLDGGMEIMPPTKPFNYLYAIGMNALKPLGTSDGSSNSYWYKDATPIMAKYEIQIATSS